MSRGLGIALRTLVSDARLSLLLGREDAFRVSDNMQPSVVKAVPSRGCWGLRSVRA